MRKILAVLALLALGACQSTPPAPAKLWVVSTSKDEFTDVVTQMVTVGSFTIRDRTYTEAGKLYPFVGTRNGQVYVGIRSGGKVRIPAGTVQLRIDDLPAWTISPDETPVDLAPALPATTPALQQASAQVMERMAKSMSPYTAATGAKANDIIKQMLQGKTLRYRKVGLNQAASTTGETRMDASFADALRAIGIDPARL